MSSPSLQSLPQELLFMIFEAQSSVPDVLALSQSCRLLFQVLEGNREKILETICRREIVDYEYAMSLAYHQEAYVDPPSQSPNKIYLRLYKNDQDARRVTDFLRKIFKAEIASAHIWNRWDPRYRRGCCPIHWRPGRNLEDALPVLPHERLRIHHCWYFIKLFETFHGHEYHEYPPLQALMAQLQNMEAMQFNTLGTILGKILSYPDPKLQHLLEDKCLESFKITNPGMMSLQKPQWYHLCEYVHWGFLGAHYHTWTNLMTPFDVCFDSMGKGPCVERDPDLGLWDIAQDPRETNVGSNPIYNWINSLHDILGQTSWYRLCKENDLINDLAPIKADN